MSYHVEGGGQVVSEEHRQEAVLVIGCNVLNMEQNFLQTVIFKGSVILVYVSCTLIYTNTDASNLF